jgi:glyoxylase-like metal-dependent hydrolase (beta-lactamase superfamily II)
VNTVGSGVDTGWANCGPFVGIGFVLPLAARANAAALARVGAKAFFRLRIVMHANMDGPCINPASGTQRLGQTEVYQAMIALSSLPLLLLLAQTPDSLLAAVRALSGAIPGERPAAIGYLTFSDDSGLAGNAVDGASPSRTLSVYSVFQIQFRHGSIMVDAGLDSASLRTLSKRRPFDARHYAEIQTALEKANLIVVTHEHVDHVGTLVHSSIAGQVAPHTLLTRAQMETLLTKPRVAFTSLDSSRAGQYLVVDYDRALPIAPGVVLIKAAGHTPGSQMVYVKLVSGREIILSGDIAWLALGIQQQRQKPDSTSRFMSEDRAAIGRELAWLKAVEAEGITVVVSHDGTQLESLAKSGVLMTGLQ